MSTQPAADPGSEPRSDERRVVAVTAWLVLALAAALLTPLMMTPFLGDDTYQSVVLGQTADAGESVLKLILDVSGQGLHQDGRIELLALAQYFGIFAAVPNLLAYKAVQVAFVLLNLGTLYLFLRSIKVARLTSLVMVALALTTLQIRVYHDPLLGFSLLYPVMLELNLLSFLLFAKYLDTQRMSAIAWSAVLFILALFYYETSYPLSIVHVLIAVRMRGWSAWRTATPFVVFSAVFFAAALVIRRVVHMAPGSTYHLGLDPSLYLATLAKQLVAAVPLSYTLNLGPELFGSWWQAYDYAPWFTLLPIAILGTAALALPLIKGRRVVLSEAGLGRIALIGAALWFFSAVLLATLPRYQSELRFGLGYLPVYFEDYGAALVLASGVIALLQLVARHANTWQWCTAAVAVALVFSFVLSVTYAANAFVVHKYEPEKYGRELVWSAVHGGALRHLSAGDTVFINGPSETMRHFEDSRNSKFFMRQASGVDVVTRPVESVASDLGCRAFPCVANAKNAYVMVSIPLDGRSGYSVVGRIVSVVTVSEGGVSATTPALRDVEVFTMGPQLGTRPADTAYDVRWLVSGCPGKAATRRYTASLDQLATERSGPEWRLATLPASCGAIPLASVGISSSGL